MAETKESKQFAILKLSGNDAHSFLEAQASNSLKDTRNGKGVYVSFLNPQGKIRNLVYIFCLSDPEQTNTCLDFALVIDSKKVQNLKTDLEKFIIIEDVSTEIISEELGSIPADLVLEEFGENDTLIKLNLIDKYVDFEKGCFPGQEVLSKYKNIGLKKKEERAQKYVDEALEIFNSAPNIDENSSSEETKKFQKACEEAVSLLKKAISENPKNEDAYESLGVILGRQSKYEEAIRVMKQLELINPESIMAQTNLSIFYMKLGDKETAEEYKAKSTVLQFDEALKNN